MFGPGAAPIVVLSKSKSIFRLSLVWQIAYTSGPSNHDEHFDYRRSEHEARHWQKGTEREYSSGQGERPICHIASDMCRFIGHSLRFPQGARPRVTPKDRNPYYRSSIID